MILINIVMWN